MIKKGLIKRNGNQSDLFCNDPQNCRTSFLCPDGSNFEQIQRAATVAYAERFLFTNDALVANNTVKTMRHTGRVIH